MCDNRCKIIDKKESRNENTKDEKQDVAFNDESVIDKKIFENQEIFTCQNFVMERNINFDIHDGLSLKIIPDISFFPKIDYCNLGLSNLGNTCFMNTGLQLLLHIPELVGFFTTKYWVESRIIIKSEKKRNVNLRCRNVNKDDNNINIESQKEKLNNNLQSKLKMNLQSENANMNFQKENYRKCNKINIDSGVKSCCKIESVFNCVHKEEKKLNKHEYLFSEYINSKNKLGFQGRVAKAFSNLIIKFLESQENNSFNFNSKKKSQSWFENTSLPFSYTTDQNIYYISPTEFRYIFGKSVKNFLDYRQHDCSEFIEMLLDSLHEDLKIDATKEEINDIKSPIFEKTLLDDVNHIENNNNIFKKNNKVLDLRNEVISNKTTADKKKDMCVIDNKKNYDVSDSRNELFSNISNFGTEKVSPVIDNKKNLIISDLENEMITNKTNFNPKKVIPIVCNEKEDTVNLTNTILYHSSFIDKTKYNDLKSNFISEKGDHEEKVDHEISSCSITDHNKIEYSKNMRKTEDNDLNNNIIKDCFIKNLKKDENLKYYAYNNIGCINVNSTADNFGSKHEISNTLIKSNTDNIRKENHKIDQPYNEMYLSYPNYKNQEIQVTDEIGGKNYIYSNNLANKNYENQEYQVIEDNNHKNILYSRNQDIQVTNEIGGKNYIYGNNLAETNYKNQEYQVMEDNNHNYNLDSRNQEIQVTDEIGGKNYIYSNNLANTNCKNQESQVIEDNNHNNNLDSRNQEIQVTDEIGQNNYIYSNNLANTNYKNQESQVMEDNNHKNNLDSRNQGIQVTEEVGLNNYIYSNNLANKNQESQVMENFNHDDLKHDINFNNLEDIHSEKKRTGNSDKYNKYSETSLANTKDTMNQYKDPLSIKYSTTPTNFLYSGNDKRILIPSIKYTKQSHGFSFISDLFYGVFKSTLQCLQCRNKKTSYDSFISLNLPIPKDSDFHNNLFLIYTNDHDINKKIIKRINGIDVKLKVSDLRLIIEDIFREIYKSDSRNTFNMNNNYCEKANIQGYGNSSNKTTCDYTNIKKDCDSKSNNRNKVPDCGNIETINLKDNYKDFNNHRMKERYIDIFDVSNDCVNNFNNCDSKNIIDNSFNLTNHNYDGGNSYFNINNNDRNYGQINKHEIGVKIIDDNKENNISSHDQVGFDDLSVENILNNKNKNVQEHIVNNLNSNIKYNSLFCNSKNIDENFLNGKIDIGQVDYNNKEFFYLILAVSKGKVIILNEEEHIKNYKNVYIYPIQMEVASYLANEGIIICFLRKRSFFDFFSNDYEIIHYPIILNDNLEKSRSLNYIDNEDFLLSLINSKIIYNDEFKHKLITNSSLREIYTIENKEIILKNILDNRKYINTKKIKLFNKNSREFLKVDSKNINNDADLNIKMSKYDNFLGNNLDVSLKVNNGEIDTLDTFNNCKIIESSIHDKKNYENQNDKIYTIKETYNSKNNYLDSKGLIINENHKDHSLEKVDNVKNKCIDLKTETNKENDKDYILEGADKIKNKNICLKTRMNGENDEDYSLEGANNIKNKNIGLKTGINGKDYSLEGANNIKNKYIDSKTGINKENDRDYILEGADNIKNRCFDSKDFIYKENEIKNKKINKAEINNFNQESSRNIKFKVKTFKSQKDDCKNINDDSKGDNERMSHLRYFNNAIFPNINIDSVSRKNESSFKSDDNERGLFNKILPNSSNSEKSEIILINGSEDNKMYGSNIKIPDNNNLNFHNNKYLDKESKNDILNKESNNKLLFTINNTHNTALNTKINPRQFNFSSHEKEDTEKSCFFTERENGEKSIINTEQNNFFFYKKDDAEAEKNIINQKMNTQKNYCNLGEKVDTEKNIKNQKIYTKKNYCNLCEKVDTEKNIKNQKMNIQKNYCNLGEKVDTEKNIINHKMNTQKNYCNLGEKVDTEKNIINHKMNTKPFNQAKNTKDLYIDDNIEIFNKGKNKEELFYTNNMKDFSSGEKLKISLSDTNVTNLYDRNFKFDIFQINVMINETAFKNLIIEKKFDGDLNINDCLKRFGEKEYMFEKDSMPYCDLKCNNFTPHSKKIEIHKYPKYLLCVLKRFEVSRNGKSLEKITKYIDIFSTRNNKIKSKTSTDSLKEQDTEIKDINQSINLESIKIKDNKNMVNKNKQNKDSNTVDTNSFLNMECSQTIIRDFNKNINTNDASPKSGNILGEKMNASNKCNITNKNLIQSERGCTNNIEKQMNIKLTINNEKKTNNKHNEDNINNKYIINNENITNNKIGGNNENKNCNTKIEFSNDNYLKYTATDNNNEKNVELNNNNEKSDDLNNNYYLKYTSNDLNGKNNEKGVEFNNNNHLKYTNNDVNGKNNEKSDNLNNNNYLKYANNKNGESIIDNNPIKDKSNIVYEKYRMNEDLNNFGKEEDNDHLDKEHGFLDLKEKDLICKDKGFTNSKLSIFDHKCPIYCNIMAKEINIILYNRKKTEMEVKFEKNKYFGENSYSRNVVPCIHSYKENNNSKVYKETANQAIKINSANINYEENKFVFKENNDRNTCCYEHIACCKHRHLDNNNIDNKIENRTNNTKEKCLVNDCSNSSIYSNLCYTHKYELTNQQEINKYSNSFNNDKFVENNNKSKHPDIDEQYIVNFNDVNYECLSFGCHIGNSYGSGHYIAYVRKENDWTCYNDTNVQKTTVKDLRIKDAYVIVYKRYEKE